MSTKKPVEYSAEAVKIADFLKANPGVKMSFAEIAEKAGVDNKSGYLRSVKAILGDALVVGDKDMEVEVKAIRKVNSYTYNG